MKRINVTLLIFVFALGTLYFTNAGYTAMGTSTANSYTGTDYVNYDTSVLETWKQVTNELNLKSYKFDVVRDYSYKTNSFNLLGSFDFNVDRGESILFLDATQYNDNTVTWLTNGGYTVDTFAINTGTPSLETLASYPLVVVITDMAPNQPDVLGDNLADYLDLGGKVVATTFSYTDSWGIDGRFGESYAPFTYTNDRFDSATYSGGSNHPIMNGIEFLSASNWLTGSIQLTDGSELLVSWDNEIPMVAEKGDVLGINFYPELGAGGDVGTFMNNAAAWMIAGGTPDEAPGTIYVDGNDGLFDFPGDGTAENPFVIADRVIAGNNDLITIKNTDLHVVIDNNTLTGQNGETYGLLLDNVTNVVVIGNTISNHGTGFGLLNSDHVTAQDNTISFNNGNGVYLFNSDDNTFTHNTVTNNGGDGFFIQDSDNNVFSQNTVGSNGFSQSLVTELYTDGVFDSSKVIQKTEDGYSINAGFSGGGFFLDPSYGNVLDNNTVNNNAGIGVYLQLSEDNTVSNNEVNSNGLTGVFLEDSHNNDFDGNTVAGNGNPQYFEGLSLNKWDMAILAGFSGGGFFLDPSENNTVTNNEVYDNLGNGVTLEYSNGTTVDGNVIRDNGQTGVFVNSSSYGKFTGNLVSGNGQNVDLSDQGTLRANFEMRIFAGFSGGGFFLDPAEGNVVDNNIVFGNVGNGVTLDHSTDTVVNNNDIMSNGGDGVFLFNSDNNELTNNEVTGNGYGFAQAMSNYVNSMPVWTFAGFSGGGFFLDPSNYNTLSGNTVSDNAAVGVYLLDSSNTTVDQNSVSDNGIWGVVLEDSDDNTFTANNVTSNGEASAVIGLATNAGFSGGGFFLDPSRGNVLIDNIFDFNFGDGFLSVASTITQILNNFFNENLGYGVNLDATTADTSVSENDFTKNNGEASQARDDNPESDNSFEGNYFDDADLTDEDGDGVADNPYQIDGDAGNSDETPVTAPVTQVSYIEAEIDVKPDRIKVWKTRYDVEVTVTLPGGFVIQEVDPSNFYLNETVQAYDVQVLNSKTFVLFFDRSEVNDLVDLDPEMGKRYNVVLELTGTMNDGLIELTGQDTVKVQRRGSPPQAPPWWWWFIFIIFRWIFRGRGW